MSSPVSVPSVGSVASRPSPMITHLSRQKVEKIRLLLAVLYRKTWGVPE